MSLPSAWVDRIHARLLVRYGAAWIRMWEGVPEEAVKADWADVLSGLSMDAIQHGLEYLPADRPPNAQQFRDVCRSVVRREPLEEILRLDAPPPDKTRVAAELERLKTWRREMEESMRRADEVPKDYKRTEGFSGPFTPIPDHLLPPGMRKDAK